jgi:hypothetical protein
MALFAEIITIDPRRFCLPDPLEIFHPGTEVSNSVRPCVNTHTKVRGKI